MGLPGSDLPFLGWTFVSLLAASFLVYYVVSAIRLVYFHPLSKFPGPKLFAASGLPVLWRSGILGCGARDLVGLHKRYGPIVRVGPDRLSMTGNVAWPHVFAHRHGDQVEFGKKLALTGDGTHTGIFGAARDDHRRQRRLLSHAFSDAALRGQEHYLAQHLDLLVRRFKELEAAGEQVDMVRWFNYLTFDIIGDLAFGDPFNSLLRSDYHPWVSMMTGGIRGRSIMLFASRYPLLKPLAIFMLGQDNIRQQKEVTRLSREKAEKRIAMGANSRPDFMTHVLRHNTDGKGMSCDEIISTSNTLILAGSETSATALSGFFFLLGRNPQSYARLTAEIRSVFPTESSITMLSVAHLDYLDACLKECLRIYPPAAGTSPRMSPGDYVAGEFIPTGTRITVSILATNHSPDNFTCPETFLPERWLLPSHELADPDSFKDDNRGAFKPFSFGPRDCVGKKLAYAEMRLAIARVLWNFDVDVVPGQEGWMKYQRCFFFWEKPPLMVRLKAIKRT